VYIEPAVTRAQDSSRNQVSELAVAGAARILKREVDPAAHADLLAEIRREL
jgi:F-type H+-transporting ATPase subunit b